MNNAPTSELAVYLNEYTRDDIIARYISETAGNGIAHVLRDVYAPIYLRAIRALRAVRPSNHGFRVLEYGCGGGMNLLKLAELMHAEGLELESAVGADFSAPMIEAAREEAARHMPADLNARLTYVVANNESLFDDLARNLGPSKDDLRGTFDLIVGVNTYRYSHRLHRQDKTAEDIRDLLRPGGYSIMIDMNRDFPFFRSKMRRMFTPQTIETYVPPLREYTAPFVRAGFEIEASRNFCWIPHSANPGLVAFCRAVAPILNACFAHFAMRSLVVARKPR